MLVFFLTIPLMLMAVAIATVPLVVTSLADRRRLKATVPVNRPPGDR